MATTYSTMLPLGTRAPDFELPDVMSGRSLSLEQLRGACGTLIVFMCNHCPYVMHVKMQLITIAQYYQARGIAVIAISANDIVDYPQDAPDKMQILMQEWGNPFSAYLYDASQKVAKAYQAACTPDFFLFDTELRCVYRGRLDASSPKNNIPVTGDELRMALDGLLNGAPPRVEQNPSVGCNIKWKAES